MKKKLSRYRQLPQWWLRFIDAHPAVPTVIYSIGLLLILFLLTPTTSIAEKPVSAPLVDVFTAAFKSEQVVDHTTSLREVYRSWMPVEIRVWLRDFYISLEMMGSFRFLDWLRGLYGNLTLYLVVPFLLLLEYLFPCNPSQPLIGKAVLQDTIWFVVHVPIKILVLGTVYQFLGGFYDNYLAFLTIGFVTAWPAYLQIAVALIVMEFCNWLFHVARHKIRLLWLFHAVHHSQKEINVFTDDRTTLVEHLARPLLSFIPFAMFQIPSIYAIAVISLFGDVHSRFVHANVKINLGWLGWFFVSPQFHRIHHSTHPAHLNKNFGGLLSIFDHLFGTAYPARDIYPETGIADARFPSEDKVRVVQLPVNFLLQNLYPFVQLFDLLSPRRRRRTNLDR